MVGVLVSGALVTTLLPGAAWAVPPGGGTRDGVELPGLQQDRPLPADEAGIEALRTWSGAPVEPLPEYNPSAVSPPAGGTASVSLESAGADLVQAGTLPVRIGQASATPEDPAPPAPDGDWSVSVEPRQSTEEASVDGAIITVTPPAGGSTPVDVELDYSAFEDLYGTEWSTRLKLTQLPECFLTTPELPECTTAVEVSSENDPATGTVRATVDPADAPTTGLSPQSGGGPAVLAASDSASGAGGTYKATPLSPSGTWSAGGSSGGFSWSYPLTVPAPPAGPAPRIAFAYSSQSVDGRTSVTNGQASWIGDGWDYNPGFVERRYRSCSEDRQNSPNNTGSKDKKKSDLCWASDNLSLSLNGSTTEMVRDDDSGTWYSADGDNTRIEYKTRTGSAKSAQTGAYDGEYWVVTTADGTRYWFGRNTLTGHGTTNSVFTVPVFGNHSGEPCHATAYADSSCTQAWRWNLDYVEDTLGNAMVIDWAQEKNDYARNGDFTKHVTYVRGGHPTQILYGLRAGALDGPPAGKVTFSVAQRCIKEGAVSCSDTEFTSKNYADKQPWWDTPSTLHCEAEASKKCYISSPTFWSRVRLSAVTTYAQRTPGSTALSLVDRWTLAQSFPKQRTDTHPPLWLDSVTRTAYGTARDADGKQLSTAVPPVSFLPNVVDMPNRVATGPDDQTPGFDRLRVETIRTETGGEIYVDYSAPCAPGTSHPAPDANTGRCFPAHWSPDPDLETPPLEWFNKYVVDSITEKDRVARQPDVTTTYQYVGGGAWAKGTDEFSKPELRTYNQWRGYAEVVVRRGTTTPAGNTDATERSKTVTRYFRGMSGDAGRAQITVKDSSGTVELGKDLRAFQGRAAESIVYTKDGGTVASREFSVPKATVLASRARTGLPDLEAVRTTVERTDRIETISGGRTRTVRTQTSHDATYGLPVTVHGYSLTPSDSTTRADETCSTVTYVHNTGKHLIGLPQRQRTTVGDCAQAASATGNQVVSDVRTSYDALDAFGTAPVKGLPHQVDTIDGTGTGWITSARTSYDALGRPTQVKDAAGTTTTTSYSPATGPVFTLSVTNALGHTTTSEADPGRGSVLATTDANGRRTTSTYDNLGRVTRMWSPSHQGEAKATAVFSYQLEDNEPPAVTTSVLRDNGTYADSVTLYDGLLRVRQTQTEALGGGRIVTDTFHNDGGGVRLTNNGYLTEGEPTAEIFLPETVSEVPSSTETAYDGLGRAVRVTTLHEDVPQHTSTVRYEGDWGLARTGMSVDGTTPLPGSRAVKTWTDALGRTSRIQHYTTTDLGGPAPATIDTTYGYDARGTLTSVTDAEGNAWTYSYDVRGRKTASTDPDTGAAHFGYDDLDRQIWSQDGQGRKQYKTYDVLGRQTELREDSATGPLVATWTFDSLPGAKGLPVASTRYHSGAAFTSEVTGYDTEYRPTGSKTVIPSIPATTGLAGTYSYATAYTHTGKVQSTSLPATPGGLAAEKVVTRYNGEGMPVTTSGLSYYTADTVYSPYGEVLRTASGEAPQRVWSTRLYDEHTGRLETAYTDRETGPNRISALSYGYDTVGNITSITDTQSPARVDRQCFSYDPMGRLVHAWTGTAGCPTESAAPGAGPDRSGLSAGPDGDGYWQSYAFDAIGNRTRMTVHDLTDPALDDVHTYTYGVAVPGAQPPVTTQPHTLAAVDSTERTPGSTVTSRNTYAYDTSGNTTERVLNGDTQALTWDRRNKLTSVDTDDNGTANVTYLYDAAGNRLIEDNGTTRTLYLGESEITVNSSGTAVEAQRYYVQPGGPTTVRSTGGKSTGHKLTVLLADHHNTATTAVEQSEGQTVTRRKFDPYGNPRGAEPSGWPGRHTFLGTGIDDPTTGLTHIGAREYDASTGRFISADPIIDLTDPLQMNGYTYANGTPVVQSDPTGLKSDECGSLYKCGGSQVITTSTTQYQDVNTVARHFEKTVSWATLADWKSKGLGNRPAFGKAKKLTKWQNKHYDRKWATNMLAGAGRSLVGFVDPGIHGIPSATSMYDNLVSGWGVDTDSRAYSGGEGIVDGLSMIFGVGLAKNGAKHGNRLLSKCPTSNSFVPDTQVLLADGSTKPIEDVSVGDKVLTTNPETGETTVETVTAEIKGEGLKHLVKVTVDIDGEAGSKTAEITATDGHPFWVPELGEWIDATDLRSGQWLRTSAGTLVQITAVERWTSTGATVHNLTVGNTHTYYVLAGNTAILVHNAGGAGSPGKGDIGTQRLITELEANGYMIRGTEISARAANGVNIRFDVVAEKDGALHLFDAKNGPRAMFTKGQGRKGGYASIEANGGTWYGPNAEAAGLRGSFAANDVKIAGYGGYKFSGLCR
ncbi:RHS repeat-associated core domain-containing protein [Streptomyces sanyensis]|uniref:RHS repeat-associated core domain-containing protein n=1 Tax=Streptomyces sanyensis TaxID=568869 RepID=A0ABP9BFS1_9ACTN